MFKYHATKGVEKEIIEEIREHKQKEIKEKFTRHIHN
jgi:hypothetical protein